MNLSQNFDTKKYQTLDELERQADSVFHTLLRQYYHEFRWSIIPVPFGTKVPKLQWKSFQDQRASLKNIEDWFIGRQTNVAIITGRVSGGVYIRDFDDADSYYRWCAEHGSLAAVCPTVATRRGFHVYCRWDHPLSTCKLDSGELRAEGAYTLLPPSKHPEGNLYSWIRPPRSFVDIPDVDPTLFGVEAIRDEKKRKPKPKTLRIVHPEHEVDDSELTEFELEAIRLSMPNGVGQRNSKIFELARRLLAQSTERSSERNQMVFDRWWDEARHFVGTKDYAVSLADWTIAIEKATTPLHDPVSVCLLRAREESPPLWTARMDPKCRILASLCRELQRMHGDDPFFLSARTAGKAIDVTHATAHAWLRIFVVLGKLREVARGSRQTNLATTYKYLGDDL